MTVTATVVTVTRKSGAIVRFTASVRGSHLKPSQSCNDRHGKSGEHLQHPGGRHPETGSGLHKSFRPPASRPGCQKNAQVQKKGCLPAANILHNDHILYFTFSDQEP